MSRKDIKETRDIAKIFGCKKDKEAIYINNYFFKMGLTPEEIALLFLIVAVPASKIPSYGIVEDIGKTSKSLYEKIEKEITNSWNSLKEEEKTHA